jgi:hypothetical protein
MPTPEANGEAEIERAIQQWRERFEIPKGHAEKPGTAIAVECRPAATNAHFELFPLDSRRPTPRPPLVRSSRQNARSSRLPPRTSVRPCVASFRCGFHP